MLPSADSYKIAESLYNVGEFLLRDDAHDIGHFSYRNRPHYYHGKLEKDHPSPFHHWYLGVALMFVGQLLGTFATLSDMKEGAIAEDSSEGLQ